MPSGAQKNSPKSGRGLSHVTHTIFGSTVGYPSDSLASCLMSNKKLMVNRGLMKCLKWQFTKNQKGIS